MKPHPSESLPFIIEGGRDIAGGEEATKLFTCASCDSNGGSRCAGGERISWADSLGQNRSSLLVNAGICGHVDMVMCW